MNLICWPIDIVVGRVSARVQQLVCDCGTKTKDNVLVAVQVIVQYQVIVSQAYDAYYKLTDPNLQIRSYVFYTGRFCMWSPCFSRDGCQLPSSSQTVCMRTRVSAPSTPSSLVFFSPLCPVDMWRTSYDRQCLRWSSTWLSRQKRSSPTRSGTRCSRPWART